MKQSYFRTGAIVFGNFVILGRLGTGGMGVVYKARNRLLDKLVALKVLTKGLSGERDLVRFQNEARILSKLDHTNVARVYDFGYEDGTPYLSMDYAEGPSLQFILENRKRLELSEFIPVFSQICDGLSHAHSKNVIHRDVKPSNIILSRDESGTPRVVIVDFGVAKVHDENAALTQTGSFIGSPLYASPEQASGKPVTTRSDMYSLGCMMFQALCGDLPFAGETALETLIMHRESEPPIEKLSALDVPDTLQDLILDLLEKDAESRPADVSEIKEVLHGIETRNDTVSESSDFSSESASEINSLFASYAGIKESTETSRRRGSMTAVGFCLLIVLVGGGLILFTMSRNQKAINIVDFTPAKDQYKATTLNDLKSSASSHASSRIGTTGSAIQSGDGGSLSLDLSLESNLDDEKIAELVRGKKIVELNLKFTNASSLEYLKDLLELRKLNLESTNIDDDSLDNISGLPHLQELSVRSTEITPTGLNKLLNIPSLRKLDPWKCKIPSATIAEASTRFPNCEIVYDDELPTSGLALGVRLEATGKYQEALNQYTYCLEQARRSQHIGWKKYYVGAVLGKRSVFLKQGKIAEANKVVKDVLSRKLSDAESILLCQALITPAAELFKAGKRMESIEKIKPAIKLLENSANARSHGTAFAYNSLGAWQITCNLDREGMLSLNKSMVILEALDKKKSGLYGTAMVLRGQAKNKLKDYAGARKDLLAGFEILQKHKDFNQNFEALLTMQSTLSEMAWQEGKRDLAIAHLKQALELNKKLNNSNKDIEALFLKRIRALERN